MDPPPAQHQQFHMDHFQMHGAPPEQQFPTPSVQPNKELYWSPRREQWRPFQWEQQPPQQQPARMSVDEKDIRRGSRSRESRGKKGLLIAAVVMAYLIDYYAPIILSLMMLNLPNEFPIMTST